MRLIHKSSGETVEVGDVVTTFRGESAIVTGRERPRSPASAGRIYIQQDGYNNGYYPSVVDCEWIEREDRQ